MLKIKVDVYGKQTNADFFRVWKLLELSEKWAQEDVTELLDRNLELEEEIRRLEGK